MWDVEVCSLEYTRTNTSDSHAKNGNDNDNAQKLLKSFFLFLFYVSELFRHCDLAVVTFLKRRDFGAQNVMT